jgi:SGNH domain (fused to AT3 domains)
MRRQRVRAARGAALLAAAVLALTTTASAASVTSKAAPPPGTYAQVAALVHASTHITSIPSVSYPSYAAESSDSASHEYPATSHGCLAINACVFGDRTSKKTIVLFGDSHAQMWLSAVAPAAVQLQYRVVLLFLGGCPAASVTVWNAEPLPPFPAGYYTGCNHFRTQAIKAINHLHPALVLLSNRTAMVESGDGTYFTNAQWEAGVKKTIVDLTHKGTKIAIIGDIVYFNEPMPQCIDTYPSNVQQCASPNPNTSSRSHELAERSEAIALGAGFIDALPWICTKSCSPVIGSFLAYLNSTHLDATYVTFLSRVMQASLQKLLP